MKCEYAECTREERRNRLCIFHLPEKDAGESKEFGDRLLEEKRRAEDDPTIDKIDFTGFKFPKDFSFEETREFKKNVNFSHAIFEGVTDFYKWKFSGYAWFDSAVFSRDALFGGATFSGDVEFYGAKFSGVAWFDNATFSGQVVFGGATFSDDVAFRGARFSGYTGFNGAKISGVAWFHGTTFSGDVGFADAVFSGDALFEGATFSGYARFDGATLIGNSSFVNSKFLADAYFRQTRFSGQVYFTSTSFRLAIFERTEFSNVSAFRAPEESENITSNLLIFYFCVFKKPQLVTFVGLPLSSLSFLRTDVSKALLVPPSESRSRKPCQHENLILSEQLLRLTIEPGTRADSKQEMRSIDLQAARRAVEDYLMEETVIAEYKNLRKSLEGNRMFTEAAELFIREMRLTSKRISWKRNPLEPVAHRIYDWISKYGESINRPAILIVTVPLVAALLLTYFRLAPSTFDGYLDLLQAVTAVFLQVRSFKDFSFANRVPIWVEILLRITSLVLFGNLYVAIRRRLERK